MKKHLLLFIIISIFALLMAGCEEFFEDLFGSSNDGDSGTSNVENPFIGDWTFNRSGGDCSMNQNCTVTATSNMWSQDCGVIDTIDTATTLPYKYTSTTVTFALLKAHNYEKQSDKSIVIEGAAFDGSDLHLCPAE